MQTGCDILTGRAPLIRGLKPGLSIEGWVLRRYADMHRKFAPQGEPAEQRGQLLHQGHQQNTGTSPSAGARMAYSLLCVVSSRPRVVLLQDIEDRVSQDIQDSGRRA
jgi:hypothetical protein